MKGWGYLFSVLGGVMLGWVAQQFWFASSPQIEMGAHDVMLSESERRVKKLSLGGSGFFRQEQALLVAQDVVPLSEAGLMLQQALYVELFAAYESDPNAIKLSRQDEQALVVGLIETAEYEVALSFLNELLLAATFADEAYYHSAMVASVVEIDSVLEASRQWQRLIDVYRWLVSVQPEHIPYALRLVHWLIEGQNYELAQVELGYARNDIRYVGQVEQLQSLIDERQRIQNANVQVVPLRRYGAHFTVELEFESGGTAEVLIDTGASLSVLKPEVLNALGLGDLEAKPVVMKTANGNVNAQTVNVSTISMGGLSLSDVDIGVVPLEGFDHDGLLGMNILGRFKFFIDQEKSALKIDEG